MKRCLGCFRGIDDSSEVCPYCGYRQDGSDNPKWILPPGTILNGKYQIGRSLGEGGFGITYLAWDVNMETRIAIKEYFPANAVSRDVSSPGGNSIAKNITVGSLNFDEGLKRYVKEASILSKFFDLPGIVSVKDFFYENNTAYFVMEYIDGMSLEKYLETRGGTIGYEEALALMQPVISSLYTIHSNNLLHRDISPDNIMIGNDGQIKLIDFGAARSMEQEGDTGMTVMLKHGYAPIEQYSREGQGPFTDVYGVCAVLYKMITGKVPANANDRVISGDSQNDLLVPVRKLAKKVPGHIAGAIERGLSIRPESRQQNMQELYDELYISRSGIVRQKVDDVYTTIIKLLVAVAGVLLLVVVFGVVYKANYDKFENVRNAIEALFSSGGNTDDESVHSESIDKKTEEDEQSEVEITTEEKESRETEETKTDSSSDTEESHAAETPATQAAATATPTTATQATEAPATVTASEESGYKYNETDDEEINTAIEAVQNGVLDSGNTPVGEILDAYSDRAGTWEAFRDTDDKLYVKYTGYKDGTDFSIFFEITSNKTTTSQTYVSFKVVGALQNGEKIDEYNRFFKEIIES
jgi:serine/threonine protein kinase